MSKDIDISVEFAGLKLANPVFTASGTCGYADELADFMDVNALGGFITKSITLKPRKGNPTPRIVETDAGMLNAIGLANVGLDRFVEEKLPILEQMKPAVFVNVAGTTIEDYVAVVERLVGEKAIAGFELNISCPNVKKGGISFGTDPVQVEEITKAVKKACGSKVLLVKLAPAVTDISVTASGHRRRCRCAEPDQHVHRDGHRHRDATSRAGQSHRRVVGARCETDRHLPRQQGLS